MTTTSGSIAAVLAIALFGAALQGQEVSNPVQSDDKTEATVSTVSQSSPVPNGTSGVRIVRLSQVNGEVQLDRKTDRGFEVAFANLPIVQDQRLQTHEGLAEVEFEDNTSLRITPNTLIEFPTLRRSATGATITSVKILSGSLYVSMANTKGNEFTVVTGNGTVTLTPSSHIRLDVGTPKSTLAVFNGSVQFTDTVGTTTVGKKKALSFDATSQAPPVVASNGEPGPFDNWDKNSTDYHHNLRSVPAAYGGGSSLYGINDLNYYGSFMNVGGCGSMWRPYLASAAWDPFANGVWAWYPGAGYSWVSPYPWGWTPFHSGSWSYCSGGGWGWRPGGQWNGLQNQPIALNTTKCATCPKPPRPPVSGRSTLVVVETKPLAISRLSSPDTFVFRKDSAGLGVPRETLGKLNKISAGVVQHGSVSTPVISNPVVSGMHTNNGNNPSVASHTVGVQNRSINSNNASNNASAHAGQNAAASGGGSHVSSSPSSYGGWSGGGARASSPAPQSAPSGGAPAPAASGAHH
ncbi:MAG TPA: FecR family protein [Edaphobacter sp.]|nr:FecR family protein [Edaphobacter sp.]